MRAPSTNITSLSAIASKLTVSKADYVPIEEKDVGYLRTRIREAQSPHGRVLHSNRQLVFQHIKSIIECGQVTFLELQFAPP